MKKLFISVIIVNWNGKIFLQDCLDSLMKVDYQDFEVILVDNASTDGSIDLVKQRFPQVKILHNEKNLGFAGAHETAYKTSKGDAILLLNTDTIVQKNLMKALVEVLYKDDKIGLVQPKIVMYPQKEIIDSVGTFFLANGNLYHYGREKSEDDPRFNQELEIFSAKGVCLLIKKDVLEKTGLFDLDYFAYFEETDLCMRILLAGYKIIYTPLSTVFHKGGQTSKKLPYTYILFHSEKNRVCTYIKNISFKYLIPILSKLFFLYLVICCIYMIRGKPRNAWAILKAIGWNIIHIRKTLIKRNLVQKKIRRVSDDTYLPRLTRKVKLSYYYYQFFGGIEKYND